MCALVCTTLSIWLEMLWERGGLRDCVYWEKQSRRSLGENSNLHTAHGQSVYLALRSVGTPSIRLFHGPPYLSHALPLPPPLPPVHTPSPGSLRETHTHTVTHMHERIPEQWYPHSRAKDKTIAVKRRGRFGVRADIYQRTTLQKPLWYSKALQSHWSTQRNSNMATSNAQSFTVKYRCWKTGESWQKVCQCRRALTKQVTGNSFERLRGDYQHLFC